MNTKSNVLTGKEYAEGLLRGIKVATDLIRTTYGPKGLNVSIERYENPQHEVANDAQTIIQAIQVEGQAEKRGLNFLKELMNKVQKDSGDGRKTTCIMAEEIIQAGLESGLSGPEIKTELDKLIPVIEQNLDAQKKTITEEDVEAVATIAGESVELGKILGEIFKKIGKEGIVYPEGSGTFTTYYRITEGVKFGDTGYLSPFMVYDEIAQKEGKKEIKAVYENPIILITKRKITKDTEIAPLIEGAIKNNKALVIFTDDMDSEVASRLVTTHKAKIAKILVIKAPTLWKNYVFEDFAAVTGATIVEDASGVNYKNLADKHLGTCAKITVDSDETVIVPSIDFSEHTNALRTDGSADSKVRLSWLTTKTAVLKLGANNESELSHKRLKCQDAINASILALKDGVVAGGGVALYNVATGLESSVAGDILIKALKAPHLQLIANGSLVSVDVIDAALVVKNAVRNAIALASTVLTLGGDVAIPPKTAEELAILSANKMRF